MYTILLIISLAALANLIAYLFAPLQWVKDQLKMYKWLPYAYCSKCVGLWLSVAVFWYLGYTPINIILYSSTVSIIAFLLNQKLIQIENESK